MISFRLHSLGSDVSFPVCNIRRPVTLVCPKVGDVKYDHSVRICHYSSLAQWVQVDSVHTVGLVLQPRKYDLRKLQYYKGAARESVHTLTYSETSLPRSRGKPPFCFIGRQGNNVFILPPDWSCYKNILGKLSGTNIFNTCSEKIGKNTRDQWSIVSHRVCV